MTPINSKLSSVIFHARIDHGFTQRQVADAVSVSVRWYQRIEKGERIPGTIVMLRLILLLDIDIEVFREEVDLYVPVSTY